MKGRRELRDTDIYVSDDLTRRRSNLFYLARQKKKLKRCAQTWTFDFRVGDQRDYNTRIYSFGELGLGGGKEISTHS